MGKLFGLTIKETFDALDQFHLGKKKQPEGSIRAIGRIIISVLLVFVVVYLYKTNNKQEGSLIIGALIGYWVR